MKQLSNTSKLIEKARSSSIKTRSVLIEKMSSNRTQEISCKGCPGTCCTYQSNSMKVTPLEALDLYFYLLKFDRLNTEFRERMVNNISEFRLDKDLSHGKNFSLRRYYTCPLFLNKELGCSIDNDHKPFGCLGFEPQQKSEQWNLRQCRSDQDILENSLEKESSEINFALKEELKLNWAKTTISQAILSIMDSIKV